jgi:hypothetical protein
MICAAVLKKFQLQLSPKADVTIQQATATRPNGLLVNLFERSQELSLGPSLSSSPNSPVRASPLFAKMALSASPKVLTRLQSTKKGLLTQSTLRQSLSAYPLNPKGQPILILWGGETGTCENYAQKISKVYGALSPTPDITVMPLDNVAGSETLVHFKKHVVLIIASTYNGQPPYNAKKFDQWLNKQKDPLLLARLKYLYNLNESIALTL